MDREDWPTLTGSGYDTPFTIPKHPKPNSIRTRIPLYVSHVDLGIALPCAFPSVPGTISHFVTAYRSGSDIYLATFAYNQTQGVDPQDFIYIVRWVGDVYEETGQQTVLRSDGFRYNRFTKQWEVRQFGLPINGQGKFAFNSGLSERTVDGDPWEPRWGAGIQSYLDPADFQQSNHPGKGPVGYPWPPSFDTWWIDQF